MKSLFAVCTALIALTTTSILADEPAAPTKGTYLITGLHCPPCTKTVEGSLTRVKGVKSVSVDWRTKNAKIEFDESILPAQVLAQKIGETPHMMGRDMQYAGLLSLKVPSVKDDATGKVVKDALADVEGISRVVAYPAQHAIGIAFKPNGKMTSQKVIELLVAAGIEASN
jgi:copper chaperone CopZ